MSFRWLIFDYIDPALNLTAAQRRQVRNRIHLRVDEDRARELRGRRGLFLGVGLGLMPVLFVVPQILFRRFGAPMLGLFMAGELLALMIAVPLLARWARRPLVLLALRHCGYDVCLRCGYYMKGVPAESKKCPECGAEREATPAVPARKQDR